MKLPHWEDYYFLVAVDEKWNWLKTPYGKDLIPNSFDAWIIEEPMKKPSERILGMDQSITVDNCHQDHKTILGILRYLDEEFEKK